MVWELGQGVHSTACTKAPCERSKPCQTPIQKLICHQVSAPPHPTPPILSYSFFWWPFTDNRRADPDPIHTIMSRHHLRSQGLSWVTARCCQRWIRPTAGLISMTSSGFQTFLSFAHHLFSVCWVRLMNQWETDSMDWLNRKLSEVEKPWFLFVTNTVLYRFCGDCWVRIWHCIAVHCSV